MQKKNASAATISNKRPAGTRVSSAASVDRELALSMAQFQRNRANVKSVDGKPTKLSDTTVYVAFNASGFAGKQAILTPNTKKLVGITNFDGQMLNTGRNLVISGVRLLNTSEGDDLVSADWQNNDRLTMELQNAEVIMSQGGARILAMPLTDLQGFKFDDFRKLSDRPFVKNNEPIVIEIELPAGVTVPVETATVKQYCRFEFRVTESRS